MKLTFQLSTAGSEDRLYSRGERVKKKAKVLHCVNTPSFVCPIIFFAVKEWFLTLVTKQIIVSKISYVN